MKFERNHTLVIYQKLIANGHCMIKNYIFDAILEIHEIIVTLIETICFEIMLNVIEYHRDVQLIPHKPILNENLVNPGCDPLGEVLVFHNIFYIINKHCFKYNWLLN